MEYIDAVNNYYKKKILRIRIADKKRQINILENDIMELVIKHFDEGK